MFKTTKLFAPAALFLMLASIAHADPVADALAKKNAASSAVAQAQQALTNAQTQVRKNQAAVTAAQADVKNKTDAKNSATKAEQDAKAKLDAASSTSSNLPQLKAAADADAAQVTKDQAAVTAESQKIAPLEAAKNQAEAQAQKSRNQAVQAGQALSQAQAKVANAQNAVNAAEAKIPAEKTAVANAEAAVKTAEAQVAAAKTPQQKQAAQQALNQAQAKEKNAQSALTAAESAVAPAEQNLASAKAAVASVTQAAATAKTAADADAQKAQAATAALNAASTQLPQLKAQLAQAQTKAAASKAAYEKALAGSGNVDAAKKAYADAQAHSAAATAALQTAQTNLSKAQAGLTAAQAAAAPALAALNTAQANLNAANTAYNAAVAQAKRDADAHAAQAKIDAQKQLDAQRNADAAAKQARIDAAKKAEADAIKTHKAPATPVVAPAAHTVGHDMGDAARKQVQAQRAQVIQQKPVRDQVNQYKGEFNKPRKDENGHDKPAQIVVINKITNIYQTNVKVYDNIEVNQNVYVNADGFDGRQYHHVRPHQGFADEMYLPGAQWSFIGFRGQREELCHRTWWHDEVSYRRFVDDDEIFNFPYVGKILPTVDYFEVLRAVSYDSMKDYYFRKGFKRVMDQVKGDLGIPFFDDFGFAVNGYRFFGYDQNNQANGLVIWGTVTVADPLGRLTVWPYKAMISLAAADLPNGDLRGGQAYAFIPPVESRQDRHSLKWLRSQIETLADLYKEPIVVAVEVPAPTDPFTTLPPDTTPSVPTYWLTDYVDHSCVANQYSSFMASNTDADGNVLATLTPDVVSTFTANCRDKDQVDDSGNLIYPQYVGAQFMSSTPTDQGCHDLLASYLNTDPSNGGFDLSTPNDDGSANSADQELWNACYTAQYLQTYSN